MSDLQLWRNRLQLLLVLAGVGVAGYLSYVKLYGLQAFCAGIGNCEVVQTSPYSELFGIPVAILGLGAYLFLTLLWWLKATDWRGLGDMARQGFLFVSLVGVLFSAYLTYLELFVILAICPWCVISAVLMTGIFFLSLWEMVSQGVQEEELRVETW